jgi:two-component system response regulator RegX3
MTKILIVEDESSFSEALAYLLGKEGFEVSVAEDGRAALNTFAKEGADLILLDLMIPEISGVDVCRAIRTTSQVPIIMLTAKDAEIDKVVGLELGADDYVTKPYSSRELIARIKAVLRRGISDADLNGDLEVISVGPIRLDTARHQASINGNPIALPLKVVPLVTVAVKSKVSVAISLFKLIAVRTNALVAPGAKVIVLVPSADQLAPPSVETRILVLSP